MFKTLTNKISEIKMVNVIMFIVILLMIKVYIITVYGFYKKIMSGFDMIDTFFIFMLLLGIGIICGVCLKLSIKNLLNKE